MTGFDSPSFDSSAFDAESADSLVSLTPVDGSVLHIDPETARFTPIHATVNIDIASKLFVFVTVGSLSWTIYDGTSVMSLFGDHTTVVNSAPGIFTLSILPNGGWWRSSINIQFVVGKILSSPTV